MNFSTLPPELKEEVFANLPEEALASVCLVSKSALALARPLLYRSITVSFSFQTTPEISSSKEQQIRLYSSSFDRTRQAKLCETLEAHPGWCSYVRHLKVQFDRMGTAGRVRAAILWPAFVNLKTLEILDGMGLGGYDRSTCDFFAGHCSPAVTCLEISQSSMPLWATHQLLERLPLLNSLFLEGPKNAGGLLSPQTSLKLPRLSTLYLSGFFRDTSIFAMLRKASPSLHSLEVDWTAIEALDLAHFASITDLTIWITVYSTNYTGHPNFSPARLFDYLMPVLDACTSLETFEIVNLSPGNLEYHEGLQKLEAHRVLHHLPKSLEVLSLVSVDLTSSYLLDFLSSRAISLCTLQLTPPVVTQTRTHDSETRIRIEEFCEKRDIELTWVEECAADA